MGEKRSPALAAFNRPSRWSSPVAATAAGQMAEFLPPGETSPPFFGAGPLRHRYSASTGRGRIYRA